MRIEFDDVEPLYIQVLVYTPNGGTIYHDMDVFTFNHSDDVLQFTAKDGSVHSYRGKGFSFTYAMTEEEYEKYHEEIDKLRSQAARQLSYLPQQEGMDDIQ